MALEMAGRLTEPVERCPHIPEGAGSGVLVPAAYPNPFRRLWALATGEAQQILLCEDCIVTMRELNDLYRRPRLLADRAIKAEVYRRLGQLGWPRDDCRRYWRGMRRLR